MPGGAFTRRRRNCSWKRCDAGERQCAYETTKWVVHELPLRGSGLESLSSPWPRLGSGCRGRPRLYATGATPWLPGARRGATIRFCDSTKSVRGFAWRPDGNSRISASTPGSRPPSSGALGVTETPQPPRVLQATGDLLHPQPLPAEARRPGAGPRAQSPKPTEPPRVVTTPSALAGGSKTSHWWNSDSPTRAG